MKRKLLYLATAMLFIAGSQNASAQITTFPYSQNFETFANCGTGCGVSCVLSNNWTNDLGDNLDWLTDENGTSSSATGPSVDASPGTTTGNYLYVETSCAGTGYPNMTANLLSPTIDLTGTNAVQFDFKYHMYGTTQGFMHLDVSADGGTTWTNDIIPTWTDNLDEWQQASIDLSAWNGSVVTVRIRYITGSSFGGDAAIDDINIYDLLPNDAGIAAFIDPSFPTCSFSDSITVELTNFGTDTLVSAGIDWEFNSIAQSSYSWTGSLAPGQSDSVYLGTATYAIGDALKAWTTLPNGLPELNSGGSNDTTELMNIQPGFSGIYTIGGLTPDYPDFTSAITDLNLYGVCGPTVFNVRTGTYTEQFALTEILNADATNTITFRSEAGHRDSVLLTYAALLPTENFTVRFDGGDHFRLEQMTIEAMGIVYSHVLEYQGGADYNTVWDCRLNGGDSTITSTSRNVIHSDPISNDNFNSFIGNTIEAGSYGVYWYGVGASSLEVGTVFEDNEFLNNFYYGARLYYQDGTVFNGNRFETNSLYTGSIYAFYFYYMDNGFEVKNNTVVNKARYGIYMVNCDANTQERGLVANNMIHVGEPADVNTFYGIYMNNIGFTDYANNSVNVEGTSTDSRAFYGVSGGANTVYNNNLVNSGAGYAAYIGSSFTLTEMNYNNLYAPNGITGYYLNSDQATLTDWQNSSGLDQNSVSADPGYYSASDLHVCADSVDGLGFALPYVMDDIDGQMRSATPDIGADEFIPAGQPLLGADQLLCTGETLNLFAGAPADTILWSTNETTQMISITTPGTYYVSVNGACGTAMDTIDISVSNLVYTDFLTADDTLFCSGDSTTLFSSMTADSYTWSTTATTPSISVSASGTYTLDISDNCGSGSESIDVTVLTAPTAGFSFVGSYASAAFTSTGSVSIYNTYLWDFGDGTTSTEENPAHVFASTGPHTVTLTVTNGCGSDSFTSTVSMVGMDDLADAGNIAVYPNPSAGIVILDVNALSQSEISVLVQNMLGETIYVNEAGSVESSYSQTIDLSNESTGMYFVHVHINGERLTKKVVIK